MIAPRPHQDNISNIDNFIRSRCVSYHGLNKFTKTFEYPITCCDDAITLILVGSNKIYIITVDTNQGYHQIAVYILH